MTHRFFRWMIVVLVVSMAMVGLQSSPSNAETRRASPVVMTRNIYLGTDLTPVIGAETPAELFAAAAESWLNVVATDFPERAKLLARELETTSSDLVGLQEVALWRTGALFDPAPAEDVAYDFLGILTDELAALGLDYEVAVVQENFDFEIPATFSGSTPVLRDIRLTMRNVILVRSGVAYDNAQSGHYDTNAVYPTLAGPVEDLRGWVSIDVSMDRRPFRFVNTHLEPYVTPVRTIQAQELVDGPLSTNLKVVAVGDFNSPSAGPGSEAYQILTSHSNGKMVDAWVAARSDDPGFTCCQAADLANPSSTADTRIDLILTRTSAVKTQDIWLVGTTAKTPDAGLWASDHFGVVAQLLIP